MVTEVGAVLNFRVNFRDALACDGRSLKTFADDCQLSYAYISRIRSGSPRMPSGTPQIPCLDVAERIAIALGFQLTDMVKPCGEFRRLLLKKFPDFVPRPLPAKRGRPPKHPRPDKHSARIRGAPRSESNDKPTTRHNAKSAVA